MILKNHRGLPSVFLLFLAFVLLTLPASAASAEYTGSELTATGFAAPAHLTDGSYNTYTTAQGEASVTVSRTDGIQGLYIVFDRIPEEWLLTDPAAGKSYPCGTNGFLHEYADAAALFGTIPTTLQMTFPEGTVIADIYAFSPGTLPDWVQRWQPPCQEADLLMISSHSDDEQLFFAGILPLYAGEMGYTVQLAYIVQHFEVYGEKNHIRPHEQLNGLWAVGITHYPVMTDFPDVYSESREGAISAFASVGVSFEDYISYITETLRRFRPLVVVSHDLEGEYGHGTHILCAEALTEALKLSADPDAYPESAGTYGTWTPEKVYLHLYPQNKIVMNLDVPLAAFGGKTAFEMTQYGFSFHKSQHWTWFNRWIYGTDEAPITKATQVKGYSPCRYGLYHTTVGYDTLGGDMFENVKPYAVRRAEEAAAQPPENQPPETAPTETETEPLPPETEIPESIPRETEPGPAAPAQPDMLLPAIAVLLCFAAAAAVLIYVMSARQMRHRRRRGPRR